MPTYKFQCSKCEKEEKLICSMSAYDERKEEMKCSDCDNHPMDRQFTAAGTVNDSKHNDPNSPWYWKKGKTIPQIANIMEGSSEW